MAWNSWSDAGDQDAKSRLKALSRLDKVNATKNRGRSSKTGIGIHDVATIIMVLSLLAIAFALKL